MCGAVPPLHDTSAWRGASKTLGKLSPLSCVIVLYEIVLDVIDRDFVTTLMKIHCSVCRNVGTHLMSLPNDTSNL